ncbi:sensor histidine kinase [Kurthia sibirica]|uniref:Heme sensor protein HssS n=1 Tax=Kurthia sibirica TaxID=202750 RepID=A0A2U3AKP8_9BACL|nr:HAMP domain-containing sensor histidine kinase [Kurthia sibirica]PWI25091.1 two-component sensor histidine kinase [Kurthia sibirica]GEK34011.1 two-component sensor histidine kinase [Kurthia sibirica]
MKNKLKMLFGFLQMLFFFVASMSLSYWLISLLHVKAAPFIIFLLTLFLGLSIMFTTAMIIHFFSKKKQLHVYLEIIAALRKISNGDFSVKLATPDTTRSEFRSIIEQFNDMTSNLQQMETMRQEFISNVSHEIQTPLTSIKGFAQVLRAADLSEESRLHYLNIIEVESHRLSKLSDNLLKLTSLESEQHPFEKTTYRLDQQLQDCLLATEPAWSNKEIELDLQLEKMTIYADKDLMSQVFINIIHNATKFTPNNGKIVIHNFRNANEEIVIHITDNGSGISSSELPYVFERFYKADASRNHTLGGNGLGLSIAKKIIELHDGVIHVTSTPHVATTFEVRFHIKKGAQIAGD